ncbi:hypothetical protein GT030_19420 [Streptomyces sp. SID1328]|uniref:MAB_1171c family putative transporter n=1 Tax=Streptomyces sp. SID1328 TaxID=2690250 RepID=UPI0013709712|nr:MAB_1171c family putative transporter [Streptomyces sp. SID1328]MYV40979.1 hypothetical protein [Streptomyces sp. SID1328]
MQQLLHPICLAMALLGLTLIVATRRLRSDPALAALAGLFAASSLSYIVSLEPVWRILDAVLGRPSTGVLFAFTTVTVMLCCQLIVLAYWGRGPEQARYGAHRLLLAGGTIIAALCALFFSLTPTAAPPQNITAAYDHTPAYQAFMTLYIVVYAAGETLAARNCMMVARQASNQGWIVSGLRIVAAGSLITLGYSAIRLAGVTAAITHTSLPPASESIAWIFADTGGFLNLAGWFVPALGAQLIPMLRTWLTGPRDYRRLEELANALATAFPELALDPAPVRSPTNKAPAYTGLNWGRITQRYAVATWHLHRRRIEIRDGQWSLRHYLDATVRNEAERRHRRAGLTGRALMQAVTADQIHAALIAYAHGQESPEPADYADKAERLSTTTPDQDVRALLGIARHFTAPASTQEAPL